MEVYKSGRLKSIQMYTTAEPPRHKESQEYRFDLEGNITEIAYLNSNEKQDQNSIITTVNLRWCSIGFEKALEEFRKTLSNNHQFPQTLGANAHNLFGNKETFEEKCFELMNFRVHLLNDGTYVFKEKSNYINEETTTKH